MRFLVTDPLRVFRISWIQIWRMAPLLSWYIMSQVLFSSFQFKFAQYNTWVMKNIAKHKKIDKYILHSIYKTYPSCQNILKCFNLMLTNCPVFDVDWLISFCRDIFIMVNNRTEHKLYCHSGLTYMRIRQNTIKKTWHDKLQSSIQINIWQYLWGGGGCFHFKCKDLHVLKIYVISNCEMISRLVDNWYSNYVCV